jgi:hypothetical protein
VLDAWSAAFGIDRTVSIDELVTVEHEGLKAALLAVAATIDPDTGAACLNPTVSTVRLTRWLRACNGIRLGRLSLQREARRSSTGSRCGPRLERRTISPSRPEIATHSAMNRAKYRHTRGFI